MTPFGRPLNEGQLKSSEENIGQIKEVEARFREEIQKVETAGFPEEKINARGQMTVWQRISYLIDPGTWCPLHTLYNPEGNAEGHTNVFDGLATISGKWCMVIGFDNKYLAGAWVAGQPENILRVTDLAKRLNAPWSGWSIAAASNCRNRKSSMPTGRVRGPLSSAMPN